MNKMMSMFLKGLAGALVVFGLSGNAAAELGDDVNGCDSVNATFTGKTGSTTSCAAFNMAGCVVPAGGTGCSYTSLSSIDPCTFSVTAGVGDDTGSWFTLEDSTCQIRGAITTGNQGGSHCFNYYKAGTLGDTLRTSGNKDGSYVSHKQLEVCTDEEVVVLSPPVARLSLTVVRVVEVEGADVVDCTQAADSLEVISVAGTKVAWCYELSNDGEGTIHDLLLLDDSGQVAIDVEGSIVTSLAGGATVTTYRVVPDTGQVLVAGEVVNTATVSGLFGVEIEPCANCSDSDTATLNVAVACDSGTQAIANQTGTVVESSSVDGTTRCGPELGNASGDATQSVALLCDGSCELKEDCKGSPISCLQPCKPSHNWTYQDGDTSGNCIFEEPKPGQLPLCQEVLGNPSNSFNEVCSLIISNPSVVQSNSGKITFSRNPLLYYFPSSGGGDSTGTIYCILLDGDSATDCPSGSFVY